MEVVSFNKDYASGIKRLLAFIIDRLALHAAFSVLFFAWFGAPEGWSWSHLSFGAWHLAFRYWAYYATVEALIVLYYSYMESSKYQATLGKLAVGIKVVDNHYGRLDFAKALLRNLSKYLSALIIYIGYIMIIFDDRKQGLHDKIADTFVVEQ